MVYFDNKQFETEELYELYVLKKYLTKHYGKENAIKLIKAYSMDNLAKALGEKDIGFFNL